MAILSRKSEALLKYERCQDRVLKLKRSLAQAIESEQAASDAHTAALAKLQALPELNTTRIAGELEIIPVAPIKAEVEEASNVLAARSTHRAHVEADLKEATRDAEAARIAEARERFKAALSGRLLQAVKELLSAADAAMTIRQEAASEFPDLSLPFVTQAVRQVVGSVERYLNPPAPPASPKNLVTVKFTKSFGDRFPFGKSRINATYATGEVAGFTREQADRLFELGVAERFEPVQPEPQAA